MSRIRVNFKETVGNIKPMHAVGQPPFGGGFLSFNFKPMKYLQDANIPYSRLHDVYGAYGSNRFVDIPNIFRNFDADECDPASYDFAFTDELIKAMHKYNLAPIFRLGVTIENQAHIKAYHINPPKDYGKWARICEHIVRHYNEGWADGFEFGIKYWEIWNEPENGVPGRNQMWTGTPEQFYELYDVAAKHLKKCFGDTIKVGGYGSCGFLGIYYHPEKYGMPHLEPREIDEDYETDILRTDFLFGFLDYITEHGSPIDFFSWHSYQSVKVTLEMDEFLHRVLTRYGFGNLERHLNEWNNAFGTLRRGTSYSSAAVAAMMIAMQNSHTDMLCYYDAKLQPGAYAGFFSETGEPLCTFYSFAAFGELFSLGKQVALECDDRDIYALAATDSIKKAILISNLSEEDKEININIAMDWRAVVIDKDNLMKAVPGTLDISVSKFNLKANQVILLSK